MVPTYRAGRMDRIGVSPFPEEEREKPRKS